MGYGILMSSGGGSGASSSDTTAVAANVLTGKKYVGSDTNDGVGTGSMPSVAGGTYNPTTATKTLVTGGRYVSSDVKVNAFSLPAAANLKKGYKYTLYGQSVTGTFEGYTSSPLYIVQDGVVKNLSTNSFNNASYVNDTNYPIHPCLRSDTGSTSDSSYTWVRSNAVFNCANYNYLKVALGGHNYGAFVSLSYQIGIGTTVNSSSIVHYGSGTASSLKTAICDISSYNSSYYIFVGFKRVSSQYTYCMIKDIYFTTT